MEMRFLLAPVTSGQESLIEAFFDTVFSYNQDEIVKTLPKMERKDLVALINSGKIKRKVVRLGVPPVPEKNARLEIKVGKFQQSQKNGISDKVDYKENSPFIEVEEGTIIVEKSLAKEGKPGINVFGDELPVNQAMDVEFRVGDNILTKEKYGIIVYIAEITGILDLRDNSARVSEKLHIPGDVCQETGNLYYSKDTVINGDVTGGFKVECGGKLLIKKNIDNGAFISCKSDLTVKQGILGEKTEVTVEGNAEIGFIQNSNIKIKGNLHVKNYIYNSNVFCGGRLNVDGRTIFGGMRGSVVGGRVNSMGSMDLHSIGSSATKTVLICGADIEKKKILEKLKEVVPILTRKITSIQGSLGIDLTTVDIQEKLKSLPPFRRKRVKQILLQLREITMQRTQTLNKIPDLESKAISPDLTELIVRIRRHLIPDVSVQIGTNMKLIQTDEYNLNFFLKDNHLVYTRSVN